MPHHPDTPDTHTARADLEALGTELSNLGGKTILVTGDNRLPCLHVVNPQAPSMTRRIYAQADFFWWPPAQPIGPRTAIPATAQQIARALSINPTRTTTGTSGRNTAA
jgi:hypothetical protein